MDTSEDFTSEDLAWAQLVADYRTRAIRAEAEVERLKVQVRAEIDEQARITFHWNEELKENARLRAALEAKP